METSRIRRLGAALVCVGAVAAAQMLGLAAASTPVITVTSEVSPLRLNAITQRSFVLNVHVADSGSATQVDVSMSGHPWPRAMETAGGPLVFGLPSVDPPATLKLLPIPVPPPMPWECFRGEPFDGRLYGVVVPAQSATVLHVPITGFVPSWPGTDYTPQVSWWVNGVTSSGGSDGASRVPVSPVTMTGPTGVHIEVRAVKQLVVSGQAMTIIGKTDPPIRHRLI